MLLHLFAAMKRNSYRRNQMVTKNSITQQQKTRGFTLSNTRNLEENYYHVDFLKKVIISLSRNFRFVVKMNLLAGKNVKQKLRPVYPNQIKKSSQNSRKVWNKKVLPILKHFATNFILTNRRNCNRISLSCHRNVTISEQFPQH